MYDNKIRLSQDVLTKAEVIAAEWGLKNARAAVEAVFRKYADEYLYGRLCQRCREGLSCSAVTPPIGLSVVSSSVATHQPSPARSSPSIPPIAPSQTAAVMAESSGCEAIDALDDLLAL
jgi:hypothetical protein